ncbi:MAG TPA: J domain-containing protein [Acidimicrobiales bacterium]|nr:J domain-containing protein [Acidimicrobiales bacterium]
MEAHDLLGVTPGAGRHEVTDAFRRYALAHHPDRGGDPTRFQAGVDAYRRLTGAPPPIKAGAGSGPPDVVFHRRARPGIPSLLRLAGRRLAAFRPHS